MGFHCYRLSQYVFTFSCNGTGSWKYNKPCLWSSVALPLGINGDERRLLMAASTLLFLTLVGRAPGRNGNSRRASGVLRAARGQASGPRDPKGSQELRHQHRPNRPSSPPAVSATSPVELQSAAWGGGELRDSASRKSSAQICQVRRPKGRTSTA